MEAEGLVVRALVRVVLFSDAVGFSPLGFVPKGVLGFGLFDGALSFWVFLFGILPL